MNGLGWKRGLGILILGVSVSATSWAQWTQPELVWTDPQAISGYPTPASDGEEVYVLINRYRPDSVTVIAPDDVLLTLRTAGGWSDPVNVSHSIEPSRFQEAALTESALHAVWLEWRDPQRPAEATDLLYATGTGGTMSDPIPLVHTVEDTLGVPSITSEPIYLVAGESGTLHLIFRMAFLDGMYVMYMRNEDGVWSEPSRISDGYYAYLGHSGNGRLLVTYLGFDTDSEQRTVEFVGSDDSGHTWNPPRVIARTPGGHRDFAPRITAVSEERLHAAWRHSTDGGLLADVILHAISNDGGRTWSVSEEVRPPASGSIQGIETLADSLGRFHLFYFLREGPLSPAGRLYHTVWSDGGWSEDAQLFGADSVRFAERNPGLDVDPYGRVHATWTEHRNRATEVYYASADLASIGLGNPQTDGEVPPYNHPNPFGDSTTVRFTLTASANVHFRLFSLSGRFISGHDLGYREAGPQAFSLSGSKLASGIYFYEIRSPEETQSGRLTIVH